MERRIGQDKIKHPCASCGQLITSRKDAKLHPTLRTLQCKTCHNIYQNVGDLSKYKDGVDIDGNDNYCRLCLDGGDLRLCDDENCHHSFCHLCIERNFGSKRLQHIKTTEPWYCFVCDIEQVSGLQEEAAKVLGICSNKIIPEVKICSKKIIPEVQRVRTPLKKSEVRDIEQASISEDVAAEVHETRSERVPAKVQQDQKPLEKPEVRQKEPKIRQKETQVRQKEPEVRQKEPEVRQKEPEIRQKEPEIRQKEPEIRQKETQVRQKEPEVRQKEPEVRQKEPEVRQEEPEVRQEEPEARQKEPEIRQKEPETRQREPETRQKEPETRQREPETRQEEPETRQKEPETRQKEPDIRQKEPETRQKEPETRQKENAAPKYSLNFKDSLRIFSSSRLCSRPIQKPAPVVINPATPSVPRPIRDPTLTTCAIPQVIPPPIVISSLTTPKSSSDRSPPTPTPTPSTPTPSTPTPTPSDPTPSTPTLSAPVPSPASLLLLEQELHITDESSDEHEDENQRDTPAPMEVDSLMPDNEVLESKSYKHVINNAEVLADRLKIHVDALATSIQSFSKEKFSVDPIALACWLENLNSYLQFSRPIAERCQLVQKLHTPSCSDTPLK